MQFAPCWVGVMNQSEQVTKQIYEVQLNTKDFYLMWAQLQHQKVKDRLSHCFWVWIQGGNVKSL